MLVRHDGEGEAMYTFERLFRGMNDTVLFAVFCDNAARRIVIKRWAADLATPTAVVTFDYGDHTERLRALRVSTEMARHLSRGRVAEAADVLRRSGFETPVPDDDEEPVVQQK